MEVMMDAAKRKDRKAMQRLIAVSFACMAAFVAAATVVLLIAAK